MVRMPHTSNSIRKILKQYEQVYMQMQMMAYTHQLKSRRESSAGEVKPAMPAMLRMESVAERLLIHDFKQRALRVD
jgi:hypothetical protein